MLPTTEVRWFFDEPFPKEFLDWFRHYEPQQQNIRTDYYLNMDRDRFGIKLREGNIQIKTKTFDLGSYHFLECVDGSISQYEKWNFPVESNEEWPSLIKQPEVWVPVKKERQLLRFTLGGGYPDKILSDDIIEKGCEVELTRVEVLKKTYWTIAFESFGAESETSLKKTVSDIFENKACPLALTEKKSFGYAQLMSDIQL